MRFLADESCDFAVVRALRQTGHDICAVAEAAPGARDEDVLELAVKDRRVLLTEDKDFGRWVFAHRRATAGVVLLRYPAKARRDLPGATVEFVERYAERLAGSFAVLRPFNVRINRLMTS